MDFANDCVEFAKEPVYFAKDPVGFAEDSACNPDSDPAFDFDVSDPVCDFRTLCFQIPQVHCTPVFMTASMPLWARLPYHVLTLASRGRVGPLLDDVAMLVVARRHTAETRISETQNHSALRVPPVAAVVVVGCSTTPPTRI